MTPWDPAWRAERDRNRDLETGEVIRRLPAGVKDRAYVVGRWVWIGFKERPAKADREALQLLGFTWNGKREVWQHACGYSTHHAQYDPRDKYTTLDLEAAQQVFA